MTLYASFDAQSRFFSLQFVLEGYKKCGYKLHGQGAAKPDQMPSSEKDARLPTAELVLGYSAGNLASSFTTDPRAHRERSGSCLNLRKTLSAQQQYS